MPGDDLDFLVGWWEQVGRIVSCSDTCLVDLDNSKGKMELRFVDEAWRWVVATIDLSLAIVPCVRITVTDMSGRASSCIVISERIAVIQELVQELLFLRSGRVTYLTVEGLLAERLSRLEGGYGVHHI